MSASLCGVVLAAGYGSRLRPLTDLRPKALCPVGNVPGLDRALAALAAVGVQGPAEVAVNTCWLADQVAAHLTVDGVAQATVSREAPRPLGTGGGVARLRDWIAGRGVLVGNADAYLAPAHARPVLADLIDGWDQRTVRLLGVPARPGAVDAFSGYRFAGFSLLPWPWVQQLPAPPTVSDLVSTVWRPAERAGELTVVPFHGRFHDTGTVADYLAANRHAARVAAAAGSGHGGPGPGPNGGGDSGGESGSESLVAADAVVTGACRASVVGAGAHVRGQVTRSVVWPGGSVAAHERLVNAVRAAEVTVTADGVTAGGAATSPTPPRTGRPGDADGPCA